MKKSTPLVVVAALAVLGMYKTVVEAQSTYAPPTPPDVLTSQTNASIALIAYKSWNEGLLLAHDAAMHGPGGYDAKIAALQAPSGISLPRNAPANYFNQWGAFPGLIGAYLAPAAGQAPNLQVGTVSGGIYGSGIIFGGTSGANGSFFEYSINPSDDGQYKIGAQMAITSGGVPLGFHYEANGVNVSGPLTFSSPDTGPHFFETAALPLSHGPQVLRVVVDSVPVNVNRVYIIYWLRLVKQ